MNWQNLTGRLIVNPILTQTVNGTPAVQMRVLCERPFSEAVDSFLVEYVGQQALNHARYLEKGQLISVSGWIETYQRQDGTYGWAVKAQSIKYHNKAKKS